MTKEQLRKGFMVIYRGQGRIVCDFSSRWLIQSLLPKLFCYKFGDNGRLLNFRNVTQKNFYQFRVKLVPCPSFQLLQNGSAFQRAFIDPAMGH